MFNVIIVTRDYDTATMWLLLFTLTRQNKTIRKIVIDNNAFFKYFSRISGQLSGIFGPNPVLF